MISKSQTKTHILLYNASKPSYGTCRPNGMEFRKLPLQLRTLSFHGNTVVMLDVVRGQCLDQNNLKYEQTCLNISVNKEYNKGRRTEN
jgi:hypothetical protein